YRWRPDTYVFLCGGWGLKLPATRLGVCSVRLAQNNQCYTTENGQGCKNETYGQGLSENNDASQCSNDWYTKLDGCCGCCLQRRQHGVPDGVTQSGSYCPRNYGIPNTGDFQAGV